MAIFSLGQELSSYSPGVGLSLVSIKKALLEHKLYNPSFCLSYYNCKVVLRETM